MTGRAGSKASAPRSAARKVSCTASSAAAPSPHSETAMRKRSPATRSKKAPRAAGSPLSRNRWKSASAAGSREASLSVMAPFFGRRDRRVAEKSEKGDAHHFSLFGGPRSCPGDDPPATKK